MNTKIFELLRKNLQQAFGLPKYAKIEITENTQVDQLPWTPARFRKFKTAMEAELHLNSDYVGTVKSIVNDLSERYLNRFFGEIWRPRTNEYDYSGWQLVDEINKQNPRSVLDVGCGYHPFKGRIDNIVGIDPYNNCADLMVDILDYRGQHDIIIALGSINFNSRDEIEARFAKCVECLTPGGRLYFRVNPGKPHATGPYVDIFAWDFETIKDFEEKYNLKLESLKKDSNDRLYFVMSKPSV